MISPLDITLLFEKQQAAWPAADERIRALSEVVERRKVGPYLVQWNPARAVSTMAKVDAKALQERPCFLCKKNRPAEQEGIMIEDGRWEVLINPFPILSHHLTIVSTQHEPQRLTREDLHTMVTLSEQLAGYTIFYNGARCGASAPDHKHLQAGITPEELPLWQRKPMKEQEAWDAVQALPVEEGREEPDFNMLVRNGHCWLVPRKAHRPKCYHDGTCMVSPGALDMAGLIITPREQDFRSITQAEIDEIMAECGGVRTIVSVGIMEAPEIRYKENGDGTFTLFDVTIGKDFHWQRKMLQTFRGALRIVENPANGMQIAINDIDIEDYLTSVISSEMSGTSSLELLKAHAVISRSWVMRMKERRGEKGAVNNVPSTNNDEHIRWYDSSTHTLFDVCADDHCQRYQGLGGVNAIVKQAVDETRGEVLISAEGQLCDARFSKCCGGRTERFSACWEDEDYDYLQPVDCPFCDTQDKQLLSQVLNGYDQETPDFHHWTMRLTQQEISRLAEEKLHLGLGTILDLRPLERGESGRIIRLAVEGTGRSVIVGKELEIRRMLSPTHLYSSAFSVEREGTDFLLRGRGWGHGVGLCQIGAAAMASQGFSYKEILTHYYPTSKVGRMG